MKTMLPFILALVVCPTFAQSELEKRQQEADQYFSRPPTGLGVGTSKDPYLPPSYQPPQGAAAQSPRELLPSLFQAAQLGLRPENRGVDKVIQLLDAGADPSQKDSKGQTAIFAWATSAITSREFLYPQQQETMYRDFLGIAKAFHVKGADLSQRDKDGRNALHAAAAQCNPHGVLMMAAIGLDPLSFDSHAMTGPDIVNRKIRDEGDSKACQQALSAMSNPEIIKYWKRIYYQVAPITSP